MSQQPEQNDWMLRAKIALGVMAANGLIDLVMADIDAFFAAHPDLIRTRQSEAIMTVLAFDRLSIPADSQSAGATAETTNKKVA